MNKVFWLSAIDNSACQGAEDSLDLKSIVSEIFQNNITKRTEGQILFLFLDKRVMKLHFIPWRHLFIRLLLF